MLIPEGFRNLFVLCFLYVGSRRVHVAAIPVTPAVLPLQAESQKESTEND